MPRSLRRAAVALPTVAAVDLAATFVFAVEGALAGVPVRLDVFGLMVIALITSTGGGMTRDVLIGDTPPRALRNARYVSLAVIGGLVAFVLHDAISGSVADVIVVLDALGLALFAVVGAAIAVDAELTPVTAVLIGTITAVGGGVARDVLLDQIPIVLRANIYALAAALGAAVFVALVRLGRSRELAMAAGAVTCFGLRMVAVWMDWNLPTAA